MSLRDGSNGKTDRGPAQRRRSMNGELFNRVTDAKDGNE